MVECLDVIVEHVWSNVSTYGRMSRRVKKRKSIGGVGGGGGDDDGDSISSTADVNNELRNSIKKNNIIAYK